MVNNLLRVLADGLTVLGENLAKLCFVALMGLVTVDVFGRYVLGNPTKVADELSGYLLVAITFFAAAYTLKKGMHIRVDILVDRLSIRARKIWVLAADSIGLVFIIIVTWQSLKLVMFNLETGTRSATPLRTLMFIPQLGVPVGLAMLAVAVVYQLVRESKDLPKVKK